MTRKKKEDKIEKLRELLAVQCTEGNWNNSPYMFGMANGIIFSLSVLTGEEPEYLSRPDIFDCELEELDKFNKSCIIVDNMKDNDETD